MPFFQEAEGVVVSGGKFVDKSHNVINVGPDARKGEGIQILLSSFVQSEAIHDSDTRGDLGCHPGTREEYICNLTSWGNGEWESGKRAFLMTGPAGAGKSAIARTCAYKLKEADNLGASFFFFRPSGWNNPKKLIPTIVYQLTTRYSAYHDYIDAFILSDRLVLQKTMDIQFRELLIKPLQKLNADGHCIGKDAVIVIDGLDECASADAQVQIIDLVAASILEQTTPFLWAFFSRPEPPIMSAFSSKIPINISWTLPLTLSGNADSDIEAYLRGSFNVICAKHNIPTGVAWPVEEDIHHLVSQSAGLFIYAVTAIRYIDGLGKGTSGLEERLRAVLKLESKSTDNPFAALDELYCLVMMQIPLGILSNTLSLLCLYEFPPISFGSGPGAMGAVETDRVQSCCFALGFSSAMSHVAISNLHSVLRATMFEDKLSNFRYYHRSFPEFLSDVKRSKQYCIESPPVHQHCLSMIAHTISDKGDTTHVKEYPNLYFTLQAFFKLVEKYNEKLGENMLRQIAEYNWSCLHLLNSGYDIDFKIFNSKIPRNWRSKIVRPHCQNLSYIRSHILALLLPERYEAEAYILGKGDKKGLIVRLRWRHAISRRACVSWFCKSRD